MDNKYLNAYENLIERLVLINGQMYHLGQHISGYIKNLKNKEKLPETFLVSTMPIRDLTYIQNHNYYNLFPTNLTYKLTKSNLDEQTYLLLSQQYGLMIAQAYEELERFIYAILSLYIFSNGPVKGVKDHLNKCKDREALLKELKRLPGRTNNKHLLKLLRKVSNQYVEYEKNNSRNRDLGLWYIAFSIIRHSIIHDLQKISSNEYEKLKKDVINATKTIHPVKSNKVDTK